MDLTAMAYALNIDPGASVIARTDVDGFLVFYTTSGVRTRVSLNSNGNTFPNYIKSRISTSGPFCFGAGGIIDDVVDKAIKDAIEEGKSQAKPYIERFENKSYVTHADGSTSEGVPGGLGGDIGDLRKQFKAGKFIEVFPSGREGFDSNMFVSLGSALGIEDLPPGAPVNLDDADLSLMSPFDKVYYEAEENEAHIASQSQWFSREVLSLFDQEPGALAN